MIIKETNISLPEPLPANLLRLSSNFSQSSNISTEFPERLMLRYKYAMLSIYHFVIILRSMMITLFHFFCQRHKRDVLLSVTLPHGLFPIYPMVQFIVMKRHETGLLSLGRKPVEKENCLSFRIARTSSWHCWEMLVKN